MIPYSKSFNGIQLLFQVNGSSLYRSACIQGLISLILFLLIRLLSLRTSQWTIDPFVMEVILSSVTLLIVFRVNHSYERYWTACGHVHHMMSLWMDAATNACVFYMQQRHHDDYFKPPNYFECHDLNRYGLSRDRQTSSTSSSSSSSSSSKNSTSSRNFFKKNKDITIREEEQQNLHKEDEDDDDAQTPPPLLFPVSPASTTAVPDFQDSYEEKSVAVATSFSKMGSTLNKKKLQANKMPSILHNEGDEEAVRLLRHHRQHKSTMGNPKYLLQGGRMDGGWGSAFHDEEGNTDGRSTYGRMDHHHLHSSWTHDHDDVVVVDPRGFASDAGGRTPSLYLQELVHLASLCNAVAFVTLRNNNYQDDSMISRNCFSFYHPGEPWPEVDSSKICLHASWSSSSTVSTRRGRLLLERIQTALESIILEECSTRPGIRQCQHASRPIPVLGGISQNELMFLERAKGPSAKVELAWSWFSEFMTREDLAGSFGGIGAPIISNIHASLSEGMAHYNHCRKIVFMPFPFPHAQISAAFIITVMIIVPLLLEEYMRSTIVGGIITFLSVTCLAGLHEVARELENPFENIPNEIPLTVLQAMFNDSLITVFAGFHPDHYWNADDFRRSSSNMKSQ